MIASVLIVLVFYIFHRANPACSDQLTSAACSVENCTWTQTAPASCSLPAITDCPMSKCTSGDAGCVYIPKTGTCEDTVGVDCASKAQDQCTGNCAWNSAPITGTCVNPQLVCKFDQDEECVGQSGAKSGCSASQTYLGCGHQFFYSDVECAKQLRDGQCIEYGCKMVGQECVAQNPSEYCETLSSAPTQCEFYSLGECKVEDGQCVPTVEDVEDCGGFTTDLVECESFSNGWCKMQDSHCVVNPEQTPYACKDNADGTECDAGSRESHQCMELDEHFCRRTSDQCATNPGKTACDSQSSSVQLCSFVPSPAFCGMSGTPKSCGTPASEGNCAIDGCSFVQSTPAECVPDSSLTCSTCSAAEVSNGCVSTAEVGSCAGSSAVAVRVPFFLLIVAALLFHSF